LVRVAWFRELIHVSHHAAERLDRVDRRAHGTFGKAQ
jgi:hypothetical protein